MRENISIKKWSPEDRPREKLLLKGEKTLSNSELLAILIGSGNKNESAVEVCRAILNFYNNDLDKLAGLTVSDLKKFNGIGSAKAISIVAAMELARRRARNSGNIQKKKISSSYDVYQLVQSQFMDLKHEEFWVVLLSRSNEVISMKQISRGGVSGTLVDQKLIFKFALDDLASSIVLVHNHPSGNVTPSQADLELTGKVKSACSVLDITLLDHVIFVNNSYLSFADEGII